MKSDSEIRIVLPERIPVLTSCRHSSSGIGRKIEEYHLYLENIVFPILPEWDVQVQCLYGHQYGMDWQLDSAPENFTGILPDDVSEFPLSVVIYDAFGRELARKSTVIELYADDDELPLFRVLPIGDSMTQAQMYLEHTAEKSQNLFFIGTRSFNGWLGHEGRGGFSTKDYTEKFQDPYAPSPFMFPKGVDGKRYYGDMTFWQQVEKCRLTQPYVYSGYKKQPLNEGMIYNREGVLYLWQNGKETLWSDHPEWEFHFSKYMARFQLEKPDAVSILLGTNDVLPLHYDTMEQGVESILDRIRMMVDSIRAYAKDLKILLCLPVLPTKDAVAFGRCYGCDKHPKEARMIMSRLVEVLIGEWDRKEDQNIFLVPMYAVLHPVYGFPEKDYPQGRYFNRSEKHNEDAIHPNRGGYAQMGDALVAVIQKIRL